jgi:hypothetical protein
MKYDLSIIIINYNTVDLTLQCISSIYNFNNKLNLDVIVVDNNSSDDSCFKISNQFPDVALISSKQNEGFGRANNLGVSNARSNHILLLNSDTLVFNNTIEKALSRYKKEQNDVGMITCQLLNLDHSKQKSVFLFNASFREVLNNNLLFDFIAKRSNSKKQTEIKALHGAFLLFEKNKFEKIGFFDPDFFLYAEEFEWCYRIRKNGMKLKLYDDLNIIHLDGGSSVSKKWNTKQRYLSNALLFKKTHGSLGLVLYIKLNFLNLITNYILMWKLDSNYRSDFMKSQSYFWSLLPKYMSILIGQNKTPLKLY